MSGSQPPRFGETLRAFRLSVGLSQEALSEAAGVSVRTISDLERGQRSGAHPETVRLLAGALDLTSDQRRQLFGAARPDGRVTPAAPRAQIGASRWTATLPEPATPLVGRASEIGALMALLEAHAGEIVTLSGPGGVGKTRLAIEAAQRLAPTYRDGAAFVELATVTQADLVPSAIARTLGITPRADAVIEQLTALLASRELLLVLDNAEQVIASAPFIAQLDAACPQLTLLVTSRERLRVSHEQEIAVPPLSLADRTASIEQIRASDAIQFFVERARRVDPEFELSDRNGAPVSEICRRLDGLPLAIELAASRLRVLTVPALLDRLERRLPLLTGGDRDRHPRQHSMRETIAWSYDLLSLEERRFLRWMSVFAGGLSLESAEAFGHVLGLDPDRSLDAVTALVESGLVTRSTSSHAEGRFHLFETIREFGLERLSASSELDAARMAHAMHFLEFACAGAPRPYDQIAVAWVGRLATEYPNLLAAFDYLCAPETATQSLQFAAAMGPYWHTRGPFSDWLPRLSRAVELASPEPTIVDVYVLHWLTLILGTSPDFSQALHVANRSIALADQIGDTRDRAAGIHILAWVHECHEQWETARELRNQAIDLWESVGNSYMHAMCLAMNAMSAHALGDLDRAQCESEQAVTMFRELRAIDWIASTECSQGTFAVARGRLDLGALRYAQSLDTWMQSASASRRYRPLVGLADVAAAIGQFTTAAHLLGAADEILISGGRDLPVFDRPGYARAEARCHEALGRAAFAEHRLAGSLLAPDAWLLEATTIVDAAQAIPSPSAQ